MVLKPTISARLTVRKCWHSPVSTTAQPHCWGYRCAPTAPRLFHEHWGSYLSSSCFQGKYFTAVLSPHPRWLVLTAISQSKSNLSGRRKSSNGEWSPVPCWEQSLIWELWGCSFLCRIQHKWTCMHPDANLKLIWFTVPVYQKQSCLRCCSCALLVHLRVRLLPR